MRKVRSVLVLTTLATTLGGCAGYQLVRVDPDRLPSYEPRHVPIPESCELLLERAAGGAVPHFNEGEARELIYCQQQQMIRAQEEEAAARKLEAHAAAASFVLRLTVAVVSGLVALLVWVF
jgi:hypothetical protein